LNRRVDFCEKRARFAPGDIPAGDAKIYSIFHGNSSTTEAKVGDLWEQRELGVFTGSFARSLAQHDNAMLKVTPL